MISRLDDPRLPGYRQMGSHFDKFLSLAFEQRALLLLAASRALDDAKLLTER